jgi:hypothetical protein
VTATLTAPELSGIVATNLLVTVSITETVLDPVT